MDRNYPLAFTIVLVARVAKMPVKCLAKLVSLGGIKFVFAKAKHENQLCENVEWRLGARASGRVVVKGVASCCIAPQDAGLVLS